MIEIVPFKREHIDDVYDIEVDSFSIPWSKGDLEKDIFENRLSIYLVALKDGEVVGYIGLWHVVTEGHITNVAVKESARNMGIGKMLMDKMEEICIEKEMIGMTLEVRMNNAAAQKLYLKNGFKVEGIRKNYYSDTQEDALIMWKML